MRPGTSHASEAHGLQVSVVPAPASPPASAFGTFPAPARGQVSRPGPSHAPMTFRSGSSRFNRASARFGNPPAASPTASTEALCAPAPSVSGVWQLSGCPVLPDSSFQTLAIGPDHSARKPRAAVPSARGSMSTPLFFVEKTAGSSAWSSDMVGRTAWIPPDGQTAPPATPKLELPSNLTRKGCTKTCLFWPAETTNLFRHNLLAPCGCLLE